jgi:hypothetical protein
VLALGALIRVLIVARTFRKDEDEHHARATSGTRRTGDDGWHILTIFSHFSPTLRWLSAIPTPIFRVVLWLHLQLNRCKMATERHRSRASKSIWLLTRNKMEVSGCSREGSDQPSCDQCQERAPGQAHANAVLAHDSCECAARRETRLTFARSTIIAPRS